MTGLGPHKPFRSRNNGCNFYHSMHATGYGDSEDLVAARKIRGLMAVRMRM